MLRDPGYASVRGKLHGLNVGVGRARVLAVGAHAVTSQVGLLSLASARPTVHPTRCAHRRGAHHSAEVPKFLASPRPTHKRAQQSEENIMKRIDPDLTCQITHLSDYSKEVGT